MPEHRTYRKLPQLGHGFRGGIALSLLLLPGLAGAQRTPLLQVDLKTGRRERIDAGGRRDRLDAQLDALLDNATGKRFSTTDLEQIENVLRRYLQARRPRSAPRLLLFLYPGRISRARLKELREIVVDVDLVIDPCPRSVCRDSLGKHIEILGRALGQPKIEAKSYAIRFGSVSLRAVAESRNQDDLVYHFSAAKVIEAGKRQRGLALIRQAASARANYTTAMARAIGANVHTRGVRLAKAPMISRSQGRVAVDLTIESDRVRLQGHVTSALIAAMQALAKSGDTPAETDLLVEARVAQRGQQTRRFRCKGYAVGLYLRGRLSQHELWSSYVREDHGSSGQTLAFNDEEAAGGDVDSDDTPDRTDEILAESFGLLAPCLQQEAAGHRRFGGVTLQFRINTHGGAEGLQLKERGTSVALQRCLQRALAKIRFQRHTGAARRVVYPMYIKR